MLLITKITLKQFHYHYCLFENKVPVGIYLSVNVNLQGIKGTIISGNRNHYIAFDHHKVYGGTLENIGNIVAPISPQSSWADKKKKDVLGV